MLVQWETESKSKEVEIEMWELWEERTQKGEIFCKE